MVELRKNQPHLFFASITNSNGTHTHLCIRMLLLPNALLECASISKRPPPFPPEDIRSCNCARTRSTPALICARRLASRLVHCVQLRRHTYTHTHTEREREREREKERERCVAYAPCLTRGVSQSERARDCDVTTRRDIIDAHSMDAICARAEGKINHIYREAANKKYK